MHIDAPSITGGHVDTAQGLLYRKPIGKVTTKKRQGTAWLSAKHLAHLRRQAGDGRKFVVEGCKGRRAGDIETGWKPTIVLTADPAGTKGVGIDLSDATPHT